MIMKEKIVKLIKYILVFLIIITAVKILFVGYDVDEQYAYALSLRIINGDVPIINMWEPHQTSSFFLSIIMLPYIKFIGFTGVFIYSRIISFFIHNIAMFYLWRYLKKEITKEKAFYVTAIIFFSLPKIMFLCEFSNLQMWFLLGVILSGLNYYKENKKIYLLICGICLSLEILVYPSTVFLGVCLLFYYLLRRTNVADKIKNLIILFSPCFIIFFIIFVYLLTKGSFIELLNNAGFIMQDGSHSLTLLERIMPNLNSLKILVIWSIIYCIISFIIVLLFKFKNYLCVYSFVLLAGQLLIWIFGNKYPNYPLIEYILIPVFVLLFSFIKKNKKSELLFYWIVAPISTFLGVCILTNHPFLVSSPFLAYTVIGFILLLEEYKISFSNYLLYFWVFVICFGHIFMIRVSGGVHYNIFNDLSLITRGPAFGIIADNETVVRYNESFDTIINTIPNNNKLLCMGSHNDVYFFGKYDVCAPSVISTPSYDNAAIEYYSLNPDKKPSYIIEEWGYVGVEKSLFPNDNYDIINENSYFVVLKLN